MSDAALPLPDLAGEGPADPCTTRVRKDAVVTRDLLVAAARRRFAYDGYRATTVRDVAGDVGVNVALINRYFTSKEGLFAACMPRSIEALDAATVGGEDRQQVLDRLVTKVAQAVSGDEAIQLPLLLLLRSSGDERTEQIRTEVLQGYARHLAAAAGWRPDEPATAPLLLRAEVALATVLGLVVLRVSTTLEPLASTSASDVEGPLRDAVTALLGPTRPDPALTCPDLP